MNKQQIFTKIARYKKLILGTIIGIVVIIFGTFLWVNFSQYRQSLEYYAVQDIRTVVTSAVDNLHDPAVVEAKSGDDYFPEAKLYLPASSYNSRITYSYQDAENYLNISSKSVMATAKSLSYNARDVETYFMHLPQIQACNRGVALYFSKPTELNGTKLAWEKKLRDNRVVYAYRETNCGFLDELVEGLRDIESY